MRILVTMLGMVLMAGGTDGHAADTLILGDFEAGTWSGLERSAEQVKAGRFSGKWHDLARQPSVRPEGIPTDWSGYDRLVFWLYSAKANGQRLTLVCNSENEANAGGWDYYFLHVTVDWQGWKHFNLRLGEDIQPTRKPAGWQKIDYLSLNAGGWEHQPLPDTLLYLDDVKLVRDPVRLGLRGPRATEADGMRRLEFVLEVQNRSAQARSFALQAVPVPAAAAAPVHRLAGLPERTPEIPPGETARIPVTLTARLADLAHAEPLRREAVGVRLASDAPAVPAPAVELSAAVPLPRREHPFLFTTPALLARARERAAADPTAGKVLDDLVARARVLAGREVSIPAEAGQWPHHYVCRACGVGLRHDAGKHRCPKCAAEYTGWPYDQVVAGNVHSGYWRAVRDLGLGYAFTGDEAMAAKGREILLAYAGKYPAWPYHDVRGRESASAGRMLAQTLDEAVAVIDLAWGYDLLYNSPAFTPADRKPIEDDLLRAVVTTLQRNDGGIGNWQSWHNAGMVAVGFCLEDAEIAAAALNGRSGLRFQLAHSVLPDGFWYEGTAAYHFYALQALRWAAEAAYFAGIDVYREPVLKSLFDAPLLYTFPDLSFPAVNDSDVFSIRGQSALYELALARLGDPAYAAVAEAGGGRSLEALLWGPDQRPAVPDTALASRDFAGLGAAVLRQGQGAEQLYLHLDYGPHGGGHGHPDKLAVILFGLGRQLAPDPARLAYAAPLHGGWYTQTVAHNTVCVDGRSQQPTTGTLTVFHSEPGFAIASAQCDSAYPGVMLRRTVVLTPTYLVDVFAVDSADEHTYDWLWHTFGELRPGVPTEPGQALGDRAGYQHIADLRTAHVDGDWQADFTQDQASVRITMAGEPGTQLHVGTGVANNPPTPCPLVLVRRQGRQTVFAAVIEPYRTQPQVTGLRLQRLDDGAALRLDLQRGPAQDALLLAERAGEPRQVAGVETTARICLVTQGANGDRAVHPLP